MLRRSVARPLFFFKQKTAYELRISDWTSDVCSSDLWPAKGTNKKQTSTLAGTPERRATLARGAEAVRHTTRLRETRSKHVVSRVHPRPLGTPCPREERRRRAGLQIGRAHV